MNLLNWNDCVEAENSWQYFVKESASIMIEPTPFLLDVYRKYEKIKAFIRKSRILAHISMEKRMFARLYVIHSECDSISKCCFQPARLFLTKNTLEMLMARTGLRIICVQPIPIHSEMKKNRATCQNINASFKIIFSVSFIAWSVWISDFTQLCGSSNAMTN